MITEKGRNAMHQVLVALILASLAGCTHAPQRTFFSRVPIAKGVTLVSHLEVDWQELDERPVSACVENALEDAKCIYLEPPRRHAQP